MKNLFRMAILVLMAVSIIGCKSKAEKALDEAVALNNLPALREYFSLYGQALEGSTKLRYDEALDRLVKDSTLFASIENASSVLERFALENEYLQLEPQGSFYADVLALHDRDSKTAEKMQRLSNHIKEGISKYAFNVVADAEYYGDLNGSMYFQATKNASYNNVSITEPDSKGHGSFACKFVIVSEQEYINLCIKLTAEGVYDINEDGLIVADFSTKRYDRRFRLEDAWNETKVVDSDRSVKAKVTFESLGDSDPMDKYEMTVKLFEESPVYFLELRPIIK